MERGTNPLVVLNLITYLDLNLVEYARVIVSSDSGLCKLVYDDVVIDDEHKTATFQMSQEDTLKLYPGDIKIQIRLKFSSGSVKASKIITTKLNDCLEDVVI